MAPRLKTYAAEIDGVHEWIVAAPNQKAALDAFGVRQNLFAQGFAKLVADPVLERAAAASPGVPLRRDKGSKGAFAAGPAGAETWAAALKAAPKRAKAPSRKALDAAQAAVDALDSQEAAERAPLEARRAALEREARTVEAEFTKRRAKLDAALARAKAAYRDAGGR
ncbi:hypothetical protein [Phenylobacterium sp.]|uniref:hypothetical protein n=1 Tax=Phenylobacterium sp. TaxID=1871053 RepID=UPI002736350B|nr:hypothetical protein [Phenylobacterium sp.]MDP3659624.1 hypothetical protein [Phenylobacterium sp.]